MTPNTLLNMTDEELREWFRQNVINAEPDPEFHARYVERLRNIENDFETEWSQKKFKWFFKNHRQAKLMKEIELHYPGPMFWIIEDVISDLWPKEWTDDKYFNEFVDFKGA